MSIWNAKKLLKAGSINIWEDRWLPTPISYGIQSPVRVLAQDAKVSSLIDNDTQWWNIPLVQEAFNAEEATTICRLYLLFFLNLFIILCHNLSHQLNKKKKSI